ncbi:MAG: hypothetical protein QME66_00380 [Candidatus Eisenbacteria bacterium]|nr:hypothetical protein [Candidatus Eisenbacteria bacterium]
MLVSKVIDGKKFMWDGVEYKGEGEAKEAMTKYESDGFETRIIKEEDKFQLFTHRIVTDVKVEGAPPV